MITSHDMSVLEKESGVPRQKLMENAGKAVFDILTKKTDIANKQILVVCYHGNNGGDGLVAARYLCEVAEVDVLFAGDEKKMSKETQLNFSKANINPKIQFIGDDYVDYDGYDIVVDALFGTGFRGTPRENLQAIIDNINGSKAFKVSVDVPSGLNADTGQGADSCVQADMIITLHDVKPALEKFKEKVEVADIGLRKSI